MKFMKFSFSILIVLLFVSSFTSCDKNEISVDEKVSADEVDIAEAVIYAKKKKGHGNGNGNGNGNGTTLTDEQSDMLIYMREEEKLARDIYLHFYEKYDLKVFKNISRAEQMHMNRILSLLNKYGYEDPATSEIGTFNNVELQELYNSLVDLGNQSIISALKVGATVEDVDIYDLDRATLLTTQPDIINVYDKLNCGSRNHMRAFTRQLNQYNSTYTPQFILQSDYDDIINSSNERCGRR